MHSPMEQFEIKKLLHLNLFGIDASFTNSATWMIIAVILATTVFVVATYGLRVYLNFITRTGYTYGALATPIAFLLFAFFLGLAIMLGAELNNAIQEEWPAPATHADQLRNWLGDRAGQRFSQRTQDSG